MFVKILELLVNKTLSTMFAYHSDSSSYLILLMWMFLCNVAKMLKCWNHWQLPRLLIYGHFTSNYSNDGSLGSCIKSSGEGRDELTTRPHQCMLNPVPLVAFLAFVSCEWPEQEFETLNNLLPQNRKLHMKWLLHNGFLTHKLITHELICHLHVYHWIDCVSRLTKWLHIPDY